MKTFLLLLGALGALFLLSLDVTIAFSLFFVTGLAMIVVTDYRRRRQPIPVGRSVAALSKQSWRLAA